MICSRLVVAGLSLVYKGKTAYKDAFDIRSIRMLLS